MSWCWQPPCQVPDLLKPCFLQKSTRGAQLSSLTVGRLTALLIPVPCRAPPAGRRCVVPQCHCFTAGRTPVWGHTCALSPALGPGTLCRVVKASQWPGPTPQHTASVSLSRLGSADRTQRSLEIRLIGWRFFIAPYWCDGSEGLAGTGKAGAVCCAAPAPERGWTRSSCCQRVQPWGQWRRLCVRHTPP